MTKTELRLFKRYSGIEYYISIHKAVLFDSESNPETKKEVMIVKSTQLWNKIIHKKIYSIDTKDNQILKDVKAILGNNLIEFKIINGKKMTKDPLTEWNP
tara:strand:+ start:3119 stop:3418 length:300 start_codon:yes stop_codon:yes gene_type:complete